MTVLVGNRCLRLGEVTENLKAKVLWLSLDQSQPDLCKSSLSFVSPMAVFALQPQS